MVALLETMTDETEPAPNDEARWKAVRTRDATADGLFFYAVTTTGIYCRPGCASRRPKRENVRYFESTTAAAAAGFRPCKRCRPQETSPDDPARQAILRACRLIEEAEQPPSLDELAAAAGLSKYHFHRLFKKTLGVTPWAYAEGVRQGRVRAALAEQTAVTEAIYEAGYESSSRFYETAVAALGMKPGQFQQGGPGLVIHYAIAPSYLGQVLVAATELGVCRIDLDDDPAALAERLRAQFPAAQLVADDANFAAAVTAVLAFLEQPGRGLDLPLDIQGTVFQRQVWAALQAIPAGQTASYAEVAARIGRPSAARAVAGACAANTLAVAVPCHRVVRSDGGLGGYRWGLPRKEALLRREAAP